MPERSYPVTIDTLGKLIDHGMGAFMHIRAPLKIHPTSKPHHELQTEFRRRHAGTVQVESWCPTAEPRAHHAGRQEQGGDCVLNASHRRSPCVSLDRQPTGQSHQVAETQSALAQLSRMCASAHTSPCRFGIPITPKAELRQE